MASFGPLGLAMRHHAGREWSRQAKQGTSAACRCFPPPVHGPVLAAAIWSLSVALPVAAGSPKVTITGGADTSGHNYSWTVTNEHTSPVVYVAFPHYRAGLFFTPAGWAAKSTFLVDAGVEERPGVCTARADPPTAGIPPGRSAQFGMQIAARGAQRGPGQVTVRFADGTETIVSGVELPQPETFGDKYLSLIGLGLVFGVAIVAREWHVRRKSRALREESLSSK